MKLPLAVLIGGSLLVSACGSTASTGEGDGAPNQAGPPQQRDPAIITLDRDALERSGFQDTAAARDAVLADVFGPNGYVQSGARDGDAEADRPILGRTFAVSRGFSMQLTAEEIARIETHRLVDRAETDRTAAPQR